MGTEEKKTDFESVPLSTSNLNRQTCGRLVLIRKNLQEELSFRHEQESILWSFSICKMKDLYVYILASKRNRTLYIGVPNHILRRVYVHKKELVEALTKKYAVHSLVYYQQTSDTRAAIEREKGIKKGKQQ